MLCISLLYNVYFMRMRSDGEMSAVPFLWQVEARFTWKRAQPWLAAEFGPISVYLGSVYLVLVFLGRRWMREKPALSLRRTLAMWNTGLAAFSIVGCCSLVPSLIRNLIQNGFRHSVCNDWVRVHSSAETAHVALWCFLFILSKMVELGDTAFIVLRKTPLNFLHWYHHVSVLLYSGWFGAESPALSTWFGATNYFVHSIMYSYYTLKAAGVRVPRSVAQLVTILQLTQFVLGVVSILTAFLQKASGIDCDPSYAFIYAGLVMYASYFVLFLNFFCRRYLL